MDHDCDSRGTSSLPRSPDGPTERRIMPVQRALETLDRNQVESLIAEGHTIVIVNQVVLKVDSWMTYHPGGTKAIEHMVGRDATDEVNALHSKETRNLMQRYRIGRIQGSWRNFVPPIQGGVFHRNVLDNDSHHELEDDGSSNSARSMSPIFDIDIGELRQRPGSTVSEASSLSDASGGMGFIDVHTKKQIELDHNKYPALDATTQDDICHKYRLLEQRVRDAKLYDCNYWAYSIEVARYLTLATLMVVSLRLGWYKTSAVLLGLLWHQLVFTVHDAGHMGITHDYQLDTLIGIFIADFIGGLSVCWWKHNHNVHHIVTNSPEHDPDIEHIPFFAISPRFLTSLRSSFHERVMTYDAFAKLVLPYQAYLYFPVLLFGRFNLYYLSWEFIVKGTGPRKGPARWHRWLELLGQIFFWTWFGYGVLYKSLPTNMDRFIYLMISHMCTMPVHAQLTLSHFSMSTSELGPDESFPQKMLRTTMDVDCPHWLDFLHGGLQFQAIHHLFPRIPRHNLRRTRVLVQQFCEEVDIPYALYGFVDGTKGVIGRLGEVGQQAAIVCHGVAQRSLRFAPYLYKR